jgi:polyribonucleotide nucleotidyltransferase
VEVRVDDIDPQGKVSLSLASSPAPMAGSGEGEGDEDRPRGGGRGRPDDVETSSRTGGVPQASFEDAFDAELSAELGDLGPGEEGSAPRRDGGRKRDGGRREGSGGPRRRPRNGRS